MKKILALTLVLMLVLTSVFTGMAVSAEDAVAEDTTPAITETVWEEEYGIKVDESIFPGYYLGDAYKIWDNPDQTTTWTTENGIKYYMVDSKGNSYTFRNVALHRKYAPSIAVDAGRTGLEGDNALVFGLPMAYTNGYLLFNNRNSSGDIVCGSGTWEISFDVKLVAGEVSNIYSNFILYAPGISTNANCVSDNSTAINSSGNTNGYSGSDINAEEWTNLCYTATVNGATNSFYINITAPDEGAIVLIDNLQIINVSTDVNVFNSDNFHPIASASPYYADYNADTFYINKYFGNFNDKGFSAVTDWEKYNLTVDESIVPGYYLDASPYYLSEDADETITPSIEGLPYLNASGGWYSEKVAAQVPTRRRWVPAVALGAGRSGKADDNALVFGMPKASAQTALAFYVRNQNSQTVYNKGNKYKVSFDIKSVAGNCEGIYSTPILYKPTTSADSKYTCLPEDSKGNITQTVYNNEYNTETGTYGTDGYSQADISTTEWTTLTFTVTPVESCNWFYINIVPADENGAVVLIDNITIQGTNGVNLFNADNVQFTSSASTYKGVYEPIQYYLGTFDSADPVAVESVADSDVTYIPHPEIYTSSATVTPTISALGEGVNGSYAMQIGVSETTLKNEVRIQGFNHKNEKTWYQSKTYLLEFKLRAKSGTATSLDVGLGTNNFTIDTATTELLHSDDIFYNDAGTYKGYTQTFMKIPGSDITEDWQKFRVYIKTNDYAAVYRQLVFTLTGTTADTAVLIDDLEAFDITNPEAVNEIWVMSNIDPVGSFLELATPTEYEIISLNDTDNIIKVKSLETTVSKLISNMKLAANMQYGYISFQWVFASMPTPLDDGTLSQETKDTYLAGNTIVGTDYVLALVGRNGKYLNKIYEHFTVAVENDITGDAVIDARDIVRAKKISAGSLTATDAQLVAANATDGNGIQAEEVLALRGLFMD